MFIVHTMLINNFTCQILIRIKTFSINSNFLLSYTLKKKNYSTTLFYIKLFINWTYGIVVYIVSLLK